ncbi:MAG: F0F1 ATP synthase subunit A [Candidatus Woykebacteria bacterium]
MEVTLFAEKIFTVGNFPITNTLITTWLTMVVVVTLAFIATRKVSLVPSLAQSIAEVVIDTIYNLTLSLADEKRAKKFLPFVATFFIYIIVANYLGLLPGFSTVGFFEHHGEEKTLIPLLRSINSDLNVTLALALISVSITHYYSISTLGIFKYLGRYISLNPVNLFVGLLEIVAEFTKILSLSFRLFGNVFAGEALLLTISSMAAFILPLPFMFLEIIVGFVQAAIFMMLTLVFMVILTDKQAVH